MKTTTSIKLDKKLKSEAAELADQVGLSLSAVISASLRQFVNERRLVLTTSLQLNAKKQAEFLELQKDVNNNKNLSKSYNDIEDLFEALDE